MSNEAFYDQALSSYESFSRTKSVVLGQNKHTKIRRSSTIFRHKKRDASF